MGKRELVALLNLSYWCLVMVEWFFLTVPWGCLRFVSVVFPDHTHLLFRIQYLTNTTNLTALVLFWTQYLTNTTDITALILLWRQ